MSTYFVSVLIFWIFVMNYARKKSKMQEHDNDKVKNKSLNSSNIMQSLAKRNRQITYKEILHKLQNFYRYGLKILLKF